MPKEELKFRTVYDVARDLKQARDAEGGEHAGRGRAVFLVGAGCSISANIPAAEGVAKFCARVLRQNYEPVGSGKVEALPDVEGGKPDEALEWLMKRGHIDKAEKNPMTGSYEWGALYPMFFEDHLKAPNVQRDIISHLVARSGGKLNWTHACLGELVDLRIVHTVLTTNFDQLVLTGIVRAGTFPVVADGLFSFNRILGRPPVPQVVHLHGSMHTYNLRNSRRAIIETREDQGTQTMVHTLLQQCNVLVVVGYAGGEEGLMEILLKACERLEELVVYWVVYERTNLTDNCRRLMKGQNKFVVDGGPSDRFFSELMSALGAGPPRWVRDPMAHLSKQRDLLLKGDSDEIIGDIIEGYSAQVDLAAGFLGEHRLQEGSYYEAASCYAGGGFDKVPDLLKDAEAAGQPNHVRLRAMASLNEAQRGADVDLGPLGGSISDFTSLLNDGGQAARVGDLLGLTKALELRSEEELKIDHENDATLKLISEVIGNHLPRFEQDAGYREKAELIYSRANALIGSLETDDKSEEEDLRLQRIAKYDEIGKLYQEVIDLAGNFETEGKLTLEAREGLAGALQTAADDERKSGDQDSRRKALEKVGRAVDELGKVEAAAWRSPESAENAGILHNLANALSLQWELSEGTERDVARRRGHAAARAAAEAYNRPEYAQPEDRKRRDEMLAVVARFRED